MSHLKIPEAARDLNVHPVTVRRLIKSGKLHAIKVGKVWRIPADELARFAEEHANTGSAA